MSANTSDQSRPIITIIDSKLIPENLLDKNIKTNDDFNGEYFISQNYRDDLPTKIKDGFSYRLRVNESELIFNISEEIPLEVFNFNSLKILKQYNPKFFKDYSVFPKSLFKVSCNKDLLQMLLDIESKIDCVPRDGAKSDETVNLSQNINEVIDAICLFYFFDKYVTDCKFNISLNVAKTTMFICSSCKIVSDNSFKKFMKCGGCVPRDGAKGDKTNKIFYCSTECQKADWKNHKKVCEKFK